MSQPAYYPVHNTDFLLVLVVWLAAVAQIKLTRPWQSKTHFFFGGIWLGTALGLLGSLYFPPDSYEVMPQNIHHDKYSWLAFILLIWLFVLAYRNLRAAWREHQLKRTHPEVAELFQQK